MKFSKELARRSKREMIDLKNEIKLLENKTNFAQNPDCRKRSKNIIGLSKKQTI